jgi:hypothetical protein
MNIAMENKYFRSDLGQFDSEAMAQDIMRLEESERTLKSATEELLNLCDSGDLIASTFDASKRVYETKEKLRKLLSGI